MPTTTPFTQEFFQNPYPVYRKMREQETAYWLELPDDTISGGVWLFTRYEDVKAITRTAKDTSLDIKRLVPERERTTFHYMLLYSDPPDHKRLRSLISAPFTQPRVNALQNLISKLVDQQIDKMLDQGEAEFMGNFAEPLPVNVIAHLLGVPIEDSELLRGWTNELGRSFDSTVAEKKDHERGAVALREMTEYFKSLMARPHQPAGSIIETLIAERNANKCLPQEAMAQCMLLLLAGHETTLNMLGNGLLCLLSHPGEMKKLRQNPNLMESAINEILRYETPFQRATFRVVTSPMNFRSQVLMPGDRVSPVISAANRDPAQFDRPDSFEISRKPNRHLSFGLGIHRCLGEKLARKEATIAFSRLLQRIPDMKLKNPEPCWKPRSLFRALESLPLQW